MKNQLIRAVVLAALTLGGGTLTGAGVATAEPAGDCGFMQWCPRPTPPGPEQLPWSRSNPAGYPWWWEDSSGRHQCPPSCLG